MSRSIRALLYGDMHIPYHDPRVLELVKAVGHDWQPDVVVDMGDTIDANTISKHPRKLEKQLALADEIAQAREYFQDFADAFPNARRIALEGNHSERLIRTVEASQGEFRELLTLPDVQDALAWQKLLRLDKSGWEWVPYREQALHVLLPKFMVIHGYDVRQKSGYTAHKALERFSKSGASGHTHRLGAVTKRKYNGANVWVETGCCCQLTAWYGNVATPDWQQGFVLADFSTRTGAFDIRCVYVKDGDCYVDGYEYTAR